MLVLIDLPVIHFIVPDSLLAPEVKKIVDTSIFTILITETKGVSLA